MLLSIGALALVPGDAHSEVRTYDAQGRIARVVFDSGARVTYTYDANSNILSAVTDTVPLTPSDIDGSGVTDAVDVQLVINSALGLETPYPADQNGGTVDAVDVQLVINAALGL